MPERRHGPPGVGKKAVKDVYDKCMKRYDNKEYCSRVTMDVVCQNPDKFPDSKVNCTEFGKTKGKPYSAPISKAGAYKQVVADLFEKGERDLARAIVAALKE